LREAVSLAPQNQHVREAFASIQADDALHPLLKSCRRFTSNKDEQAGKEAVSYLARSAETPSDIAQQCMLLLLQHHQNLDCGLVDRIVTGLLRECLAARVLLGERLDESAATVFEQFYELGNGSANALATVVLEPSVWSNEVTREKCEKDVFQLFLAKLMEVGHDHDGKALKGIARLLAEDPDKLPSLVDEETFDAVLASLDNRLPAEIRSQATMTTAKYLEASQANGQTYLFSFIQRRIARQKNEDLILAFSAAAAVFPIATSMAASFFLIDGFVSSLIPLLEKKAKSERVEQAALEMLSAACIDTACRQAIYKHCIQWLQQVLDSSKEQSKNIAAVIMAKIQAPGDKDTTGNSEEAHEVDDDLVPRLKTMMVSAGPTTLQSAIEGLAYASTQPAVKEELAKDKPFLERLFDAVKKARPGSTTAFGALTLIDNLTRYLPIQSEEQKRMSQLKAYANASPSSAEPSPLDSDQAVTKRNSTLLQAGLVPALVGISRTLSPTSKTLLLSILLSLSSTPSHRGPLAQQGAARLLLSTYTSLPSTSAPDAAHTHFTAAHALARILISCDPSHVFPPSGSPPLSSTIRPLLTLLSPPPTDNPPRSLLPIFESLLALTNIVASAPNTPSITSPILTLATPHIEDLLLSNNTLLRRACTELVCNLTANSNDGVKLFAEDTPQAKHRLHVLLALADSEDLKTRQAAGGAVASVLTTEGGVVNVLAREGGVKRVLEMCGDEDEGMRHRGVVSVGHLVGMEQGRKAVSKDGGVEVLRGVLVSLEEGEVREMVEGVLGVLQRRDTAAAAATAA